MLNIFEKLLLKTFDRRYKFNTFQFEFRQKHFIDQEHRITDALEDDVQIFDKVGHKGLVQKIIKLLKQDVEIIILYISDRLFKIKQEEENK